MNEALKVTLVDDGNAYIHGDSRARDMALINSFLEEGQENGTVVEALHEAFRAILDGKAQDIDLALGIGAAEWYK